MFVARTRLEGAHGHDANRLFSVVEQTRGRSLLELLVSAPLGDLKKPPELRAGERQIAALQLQLYRSKGRADRQRLLDQIFSAEERLAPVETELFNSTRINPRKAVTLKDLQAVLRSDEVVLEFALAEPHRIASWRRALLRESASFRVGQPFRPAFDLCCRRFGQVRNHAPRRRLLAPRYSITSLRSQGRAG